jgi:MoaA/NifB/PqqE/SkfB family radical SAM enzyme
MTSGRCSREAFRDLITPSPEELIDLYARIYSWNIERGIHTLDQIRAEGVSAYAGSRPCQQVGNGVYVTLYGDVYMCPGDDSDATRFGNVKERPLREIWEGCSNYALRAGHYNCRCPAKDGRTIPAELYSQVLERLEQKISTG